MTRRASIIGLAVAAMLLALGLQPWHLALGLVERHVVAGIEGRLGLKVTAISRAEIALLPLPRISISEVAFTQPQGGLSGKAMRLRARARLLPLLAGRLDFDRIDLIGPELDLRIDGPSESRTRWLAAPIDYLRQLDRDTQLVVTRGSLMLRSEGTIQTTLRDLDLVVDGRSAGEPVSFNGSVTWRGEQTRLEVLWPVAGERAEASLSLSARPLTLQFKGNRTAALEVMTGKVSLTTASLPQALAWLGARPRIASLVRQVELGADAQFAGYDLSLSGVSAKLDGDLLEGALRINGANQRLMLSGTLAGADFDLGRLLRQAGQHPGGETAEGRETPLEFESWTAHDIDLRVSLDAARLGDARLSELALQFMAKKGRFEVALLRAGSYGGTARARLLATPVAGGADVKLQFGLDKVNLSQAAAHLQGLAPFSGTLGAQFALEGVGDSFEQVVGSLTGRGTASLKQGEIRGVSFAEILRRPEKGAARDWRQGKTAFETAQFAALVQGGVVYLTDGQVAGTGYGLSLSGHADLGRHWLEMTGILTATGGASRSLFELRGPFAAPAFTPGLDSIPPRDGLPSPLTR
ncbi:AsmA-like C-terminal region-containing protein [Bosea sp. TWI1241]|uniref:AsmA family protein n=1 Tax=Bosea sp. TWI1241 TaxID=3148904 RepID=UPI003208437D